MRSSIRSAARSTRLHDQRWPGAISRYLSACFGLLIVVAVVLSSVLAGAPTETGKRAGGGKPSSKLVAGRLKEPDHVKPERDRISNVHDRISNVIGTNRARLAAELFVNPPARELRTISPSSYARLGPTQDSVNGQFDRDGIQQGGPQGDQQSVPAGGEGDKGSRKPSEQRLTKARPFHGDLRNLPNRKPSKRERPEREQPEPNPTLFSGPPYPLEPDRPVAPTAPEVPGPSAPAPPTTMNFDGLDFANWGAGHPPDTNGDVGPTYYIQTVNTSIGIFRKSDGVRVAAFTFNTFMSQGNFGNLCDTNNFGDPVVLYDSFEDRWIITDFAFTLNGSNGVINPPGSFQCIAASMSGDPVSGGWNFYSINTTAGLGDYPKFGIWPDGLYMSVNMFNYPSGGAFQNPRVYAFNKAQMYAGAPTAQSVSFDAPSADFTILPSNARLQTGTPPSGSPNYFVSSWEFLNALTVYKFHVDWNRISASTFTGPDTPAAATSWPNSGPANAPSQGGNALDVLQIRAMMQSQYSNIAGVESLWTSHTVRRGNTSGFAAPRWYQVNVSGGSVAANLPQAATWDPDGANVIYRFMPSLAVDRAGNMALGYSTSSSTTKPAIKYAGRLATDPINILSQTEQLLIQGTGTQTGSCGGTCARWGDYSAMSLDPDGCTFWFTNEYYAVDGLNNLTRIGSFGLPQCTPVGAGGTVSGTVTDSTTSNPISGATVALGSRTTTTDPSGVYTLPGLPAGTYPSITASFAGYGSSTATSIVVTDGGTTIQDFSLIVAPATACLTDTTQADFLLGVFTNVDGNTSPGDVILLNAPTVDQQNTAGTTTGTGFGTPNWTGQTFIPSVTGSLVKVDVQLFCNGCGATPPNLTLSVRNTAAGLPTGADLVSATIPGSVFSSGATVTSTVSFGSPATLTSGTQYALILRPVSAPAGSGYFWIRSSPSTYANGSRVLSADSGGTWSADTTRDFNFKAYMQTGFNASGNLVSGTKDANPAPGLTPVWSTFSWNASTPASTSLTFQLAGSNSVNGPFNFVGPDGTASTFFTISGASLCQFNRFRYLKYQALLSTTDRTMTPTLNDVTVCFDNNAQAVPTITPGGPTTFCTGGSVNLTSSSASGNQWYLNANPIGGATNQTYVATASGNYTVTETASGCSSAPSTATTVTVNPTPATPAITPGGPTTFCTGGSVNLTSSSASGNQWYLGGNPIGGATNQNYIATAAGNYTDIVTASGCDSAPSTAITVTVNPSPATPTITPGGPTTFCTGGSVTLSSSSASGNQWYLGGNPIGGATNQNYIATAAGNYTDIVTASGCDSAPSAATTVTVNPIPPTPTITPGGPTTFCNGGSVTLTSSSASGNQWYLGGNPIGGATNQNYIATVGGNYTDIVSTTGCDSAPSAMTTVTVNPVPGTPSITPGGPTTFCVGNSVTLTSSSASGNQWFLNGNPISGATNQNYIVTTAGGYSLTVTAGGCTSATSTSTTVTVNPIPPTPTITPGGPTTFCAGNSVTLTSSSATGNQWYLNGNPIGGATNQNYLASTAGDYSVMASASGCTSAVSAATTLTSDPAPALTYSSPQSVAFGNSLSITPTTATDNGTVTYQVLGGHGLTTAPTVDAGGGVSIANAQPAGSHTITIRATDNCGANTDASFALTVSKANQTISVNTHAPASGGYNTSFTVASTASSALAVSYSSSGSCTNNSAVFTMTSSTGSCLVKYDQAGDANYNAATQVTESVTAQKVNQSISFSALLNRTFGDADFTVSATSDSTLSVSFAAAGNCTVSGSTVHVTGSGSCTITASQVGDSNFNQANNVDRSFTIANSNQTITFGALANKIFGDADFIVSASSDSNLAVAFAGKGNCTVSGSTVHATGTGSCTITASQVGDSNFNQANNVDRSFTIANSNQTITFDALANKTLGNADFTVSASSDSNLAISFRATGNCTVTEASPGMVHIMTAGSCTITASQSGDSNYNAATDVAQTFAIANTALIALSQSSYNVNENTGFVTITVNRSGDPSVPISIDYTTDDTGSSDVCGTLNTGMASARCDLGLTLGTLQFAATETQKTFLIPITQDSFTEGPEMFTVSLSNLTGTGAAFTTPASATVTINDSAAPAPNASDETDAFVRQQYRDFLNRDADLPGLAFWTNEIDSCGNDAACREIKRTNVSAAFFLSVEFQQTGLFVRNFYVASLDRPLTINMPAFVEFEWDIHTVQRGVVVGQGNWQQTLNDNRDAFMKDFVTRPEFIGSYPTTDTPAQYVDKLYLHAAVTPASPAERQATIDEFAGAGTSADPVARGRALQDVTQNITFRQRELNPSFVQMEYFGYLRRNPNDAPDGSFDGYNFWLNKLNAANGNYVQAEMVKSFLVSGEYRRRFGP